ncbi:uncharacterized protein LOC106089015 [Stomoxys calcitrans]|uniref:uncharacterized protein LOC106089015 n=1 Tax=Stomoxys calcitrans TaxID=35570 RepID=UPI0027E23FDB|nr:uncharacterized protein LOC106089015 [Stomoxys calcitrans]
MLYDFYEKVYEVVTTEHLSYVCTALAQAFQSTVLKCLYLTIISISIFIDKRFETTKKKIGKTCKNYLTLRFAKTNFSQFVTIHNFASIMKHTLRENRKSDAFNVILISLIITSTVHADNFLKTPPTFFTPCKLKDTGNGQCVSDLFQSVFVNWKGDIPGSPPFSTIDPLMVKKIHVDLTGTAANLNLDMENIVATGLSNAKIGNVGVQFNSNFQYVVKIPNYHTKSDYTMKGKISVEDLNGKGTAIIDVSDLVIGVSLLTEKKERDGEKFFETLIIFAKMASVGDIRVRFDNLYGPGNNELSDSTNDLFNGNRAHLLEIFTPVIEQTMMAYLTRRWNKIFKRIPIKYLFTDFS